MTTKQRIELIDAKLDAAMEILMMQNMANTCLLFGDKDTAAQIMDVVETKLKDRERLYE